jgi:hypothetical protein
MLYFAVTPIAMSLEELGMGIPRLSPAVEIAKPSNEEFARSRLEGLPVRPAFP